MDDDGNTITDRDMLFDACDGILRDEWNTYNTEHPHAKLTFMQWKQEYGADVIAALSDATEAFNMQTMAMAVDALVDPTAFFKDMWNKFKNQLNSQKAARARLDPAKTAQSSTKHFIALVSPILNASECPQEEQYIQNTASELVIEANANSLIKPTFVVLIRKLAEKMKQETARSTVKPNTAKQITVPTIINKERRKHTINDIVQIASITAYSEGQWDIFTVTLASELFRVTPTRLYVALMKILNEAVETLEGGILRPAPPPREESSFRRNVISPPSITPSPPIPPRERMHVLSDMLTSEIAKARVQSSSHDRIINQVASAMHAELRSSPNAMDEMKFINTQINMLLRPKLQVHGCFDACDAPIIDQPQADKRFVVGPLVEYMKSIVVDGLEPMQYTLLAPVKNMRSFSDTWSALSRSEQHEAVNHLMLVKLPAKGDKFLFTMDDCKHQLAESEIRMDVGENGTYGRHVAFDPTCKCCVKYGPDNAFSVTLIGIDADLDDMYTSRRKKNGQWVEDENSIATQSVGPKKKNHSGSNSSSAPTSYKPMPNLLPIGHVMSPASINSENSAMPGLINEDLLLCPLCTDN